MSSVNPQQSSEPRTIIIPIYPRSAALREGEQLVQGHTACNSRAQTRAQSMMLQPWLSSPGDSLSAVDLYGSESGFPQAGTPGQLRGP